MNSALSAQDESLFPKQSHEPPLHNRCPLLNPKETLAAGYPLNTHALSLFSPWKYCSTDPLEILFGSVGEGSKEEERREREARVIRASLFQCVSFGGEEIRGWGQARILNGASEKPEFQDIYADTKPPN